MVRVWGPILNAIWRRRTAYQFFIVIPDFKHGKGLAMDQKQSNPKDVVGSTKVSFSKLPTPVLAEAAVAMTEGVKYGRHNYRAVGVRASVYYDAAWRHLAAWWEGEDVDPDSGLSHVTKAITSLMVLRDSMIRSNWQDDRPPKTLGFIPIANESTVAVLNRIKDPQPEFYAGQGFDVTLD
jgi:hypothetical protein